MLCTPDFPLELFEKICHYLTKKQKATCQSVCRNWKDGFARPLYYHVHIHGQRQFELLYPSLLSNGHYIKVLKVESVRLLTNSIVCLPELCPYLTELKIDHAEFTDTLDGQIFSQWIHLERLDQNLTQYTSFAQLSHLSVYLDLQPLNVIVPLLHISNCIQSLSIKHGSLSLDELEMVHEACPKLRKLILIEICMDCRLTATVLPTMHMRNLKVENSEGVSGWLTYFASKYPNLRNISLWSKHSIYQPTSALSLDSLEKQWYAIAQIARHCHALKSVYLLNVPVNHWFFEALDSLGTQIDKLGLGDMSDRTLETLNALIKSRQRPSHLTLWGWPSLSIWGRMESMVELVAQCTRLGSFEFSMKFSGVGNALFPIAHLLNTCSQLKQLTLCYVQLVTGPTQSTELKDLVLKECSFSNRLFDCLAIHGSRLTQLELDACIFINDAQIHMPHHVFQSLVINKVLPCSRSHHMSSTREIQFFKVLDCIYGLVDYEKHGPTGYTRLSIEDISGPHVSIECARLGELKISGLSIN